MVKVELKPPALPLAGLKLEVAPDGKPLKESAMVGRPDVTDPATRDSVIA